ncbi:MAG TPA: type II secretion system protein [Planctomycetes bacterium]|nr:type II secretion system protein [Planctomycetota bacterium]
MTAAKTRRRRWTVSVEQVVVTTTLLMLAAIVIPLADDVAMARRVNLAKKQTDDILRSIATFRDRNGTYPPGPQNSPRYNYCRGREGAAVLNPWLAAGDTPLLARPIERDPWGHPYSYHIFEGDDDSPDVVVYSWGPNGIDESWDVDLWKSEQLGGDDVGGFYEP